MGKTALGIHCLPWCFSWTDRSSQDHKDISARTPGLTPDRFVYVQISWMSSLLSKPNITSDIAELAAASWQL